MNAVWKPQKHIFRDFALFRPSYAPGPRDRKWFALVINGTDLNQMIEVMNNTLKQVSYWCIFNKLTINPDKSLCLIFSNRKLPINVELSLNDKVIKVVPSVKYLGIHHDNRLGLSTHLSYVNDRLSQICGVSYKMTYKFNVNTAKTYYYSFVYSLLSFGVSVWGGILTTYNCSRTFSLVRRIIINLFGWHFPKLSHEQISSKLRLLGPIDIYKLELMSLFFNVKNSSGFEHLSMIKFENFESGHNLRSDAEYRVTIPRTRVLKTHYEYNIPIIWNTVPIEIRKQYESHKFKSLYKNYLLTEFKSVSHKISSVW